MSADVHLTQRGCEFIGSEKQIDAYNDGDASR